MKLEDGECLIRISRAGVMLMGGVLREGSFDEGVARGRRMLDAWNQANPDNPVTSSGERLQISYMALECFDDEEGMKACMLMILSCAVDSPNLGEATMAAYRDLMATDHKAHMIIDLTAEGYFSVCFSYEFIRDRHPGRYPARIWKEDGSVVETWREEEPDPLFTDVFGVPPISDDHVNAVCQPGEGAKTCRYLCMGVRSDGKSGWQCAKHSNLQEYIDAKVRLNAIHAHGDNCEGRSNP
jgi:hypothetical protein